MGIPTVVTAPINDAAQEAGAKATSKMKPK